MQHLQHNQVNPCAEDHQIETQLEKWQADAILRHIPDSVLLADADGATLYVNPAFEAQTGLAAAEVVGKTLASLMPQVDADLWRAVRAGETWRGEVRCTRQDGAARDMDVMVSPVCDQEGRLSHIVCAQRDITHLKAVQRLKARFVTDVSNELRAPITHIKMYQSLLQRGRPDKRDNYLRALEQETAHLEALIEDLFSLSQLDLQDAALLEHREVNLNRLVSQLAARFSTVAADQHIILAQDLDYALPPVEVNFDLIVQALTNLLGNAFVYTPPGGRVTLRTGVMKHGDGLYAAVLVDDTGAGVAPDEQARVFEPFFRGRASESQAAPGSGLGLSIVREIARLHRGHILLRSDGVPGKGSTFTLLLPLASTSTGDDQP